MRRRNLFSVLVAAAGLLVAAVASANNVGFTFNLLPAGGAISGAPGQTIGWGYAITNPSSYWLSPAALNSDPFVNGSGSSAIFDFPILGPGASVSLAYNGGLGQGLYELTWDAGAPLGYTNAGSFVLTGDFYDADPLAGAANLVASLDQSAAYSATVKSGGGTPVPEPTSAWLLLAGLAGLRLIRRRKAL